MKSASGRRPEVRRSHFPLTRAKTIMEALYALEMDLLAAPLLPHLLGAGVLGARSRREHARVSRRLRPTAFPPAGFPGPRFHPASHPERWLLSDGHQI